jgi:hypothetical protein
MTFLARLSSARQEYVSVEKGVTNGIRADPHGFMSAYMSVLKDTVANGSVM